MSLAERIRRRLAEGLSVKQIAAELGCERHYVHVVRWQDKNQVRYRINQREAVHRRRAKGQDPSPTNAWPKELHQTVVRLKRDEGLSASQIAEITGKTRRAIIGHLWRSGV